MLVLTSFFFIFLFVFLAPVTVAQTRQTSDPLRIGWLGVGTERLSMPLRLLRGGLERLGYVENKNYTFEQRWWNGRTGDLRDLVNSLVDAKVDVIVAQGTAVYGTLHVMRVPVIFGFSGDPVAAGFAVSLSRPGGNKTGATYMSVELNGKRIDLIKEALPKVARVAILSNPQHPGEPLEIEETRKATRRIGITLHYLPVRTAEDLDAAFAAIRASGDQAVIAVPDALMGRMRKRIGAFSLSARVPAIYGWPGWAKEGGLLTYGPNPSDAWSGLANYVDKVLKGAKPGDLPIERPTTFKLVVNLKTAKSLGIMIPPSILLRADEVIE